MKGGKVLEAKKLKDFFAWAARERKIIIVLERRTNNILRIHFLGKGTFRTATENHDFFEDEIPQIFERKKELLEFLQRFCQDPSNFSISLEPKE